MKEEEPRQRVVAVEELKVGPAPTLKAVAEPRRQRSSSCM